LNGSWQLRVSDEDPKNGSAKEAWRSVEVPETFERQIDIDFDGVAIYRTLIKPIDPGKNRRLFLHFDAVATKASVRVNGQEVGEHLGGWTPFRFDITEAARAHPEGPWNVEVTVDERVGHNTQGFLPVIAPHFGGIWQPVKLIVVPESRIDDLQAHAYLDPDLMKLHVDVPCYSRQPCFVSVYLREPGRSEWHLVQDEMLDEPNNTTDRDTTDRQPFTRYARSFEFSKFSRIDIRNWSPVDPAMYEVKIELRSGATATPETLDSVVLKVASRSIKVDGSRFLLNGEPLNFRGLLNWGYAPPRTAPSLDEQVMRDEIQFAKDRGFNLMKFCLWVPPKRYLELCDEMGMMVWIEYPTWHPDFSSEHLGNLKREYDEFFFHDRNHPSVMLRSLTCETGPSADLNTIKALYDQCKQRIPGAIVVDDSSWIAWNRVFDFYDDHPYGNCHNWKNELGRLKKFIAEREPKPLVLGEAITADTWTDPAWFSPGRTDDDHWQPHFLEPSRDWLADANTWFGPDAVNRLSADSNMYAMSMRKFQMETFRRQVPDGGYVVSVIRDMPKASMGLIDFQGNPKWRPKDWNWHGDQMLLMEYGGGARSQQGGFFGSLSLAGFPADSALSSLAKIKSVATLGGKQIELSHGIRKDNPDVVVMMLPPAVSEPQKLVLRSSLKNDKTGETVCQNSWDFWLFPEFKQEDPAEDECLVTSVLDRETLAILQEGGNVLLLANNQPNSFPTQDHWFLRGGPIVADELAKLFEPQMLIDLQPFDLAGNVIPNIRYMDQIDPLFMLWEAHDLDHIRNNGLLFHMPVGESGNMVVCCLNLDGEDNVVGRYVKKRLIEALGDGGLFDELDDPMRGQQNLVRLRDECSQRKVMLDDKTWKFRVDGQNHGVAQSWCAPDHDDAGWSDIRIDRHWESQGHEQLDQWAWYRLKVEVPREWDSDKYYLNFTGVDDYYDVYVNGVKVGSAGDIEKRETAFELRTSHDISEHVQPGESLQIAVAVYDWYGAGGIFRPAWISTQPISDSPRMLK